jgi:acetoin utilization deacetylase AcuC-like enzyme
MIDRLARAADKFAQGRLAVILEGGYHLEALADVLAATAGRLENKSVALKYPESPDTEACGAAAVDRALKIQKEFWKL